MANLQIDQISSTRFNALGGYARGPRSRLVFDELAYFEVAGGDVIGVATKDITDQDFGGIVLARDQRLRFRCVNVTEFRPTAEEAREILFAGMREAACARIEDHYQGDEDGEPADFFTHLR